MITDENGIIEQEINFDAWGRMRNPTDWTYYSAAATAAIMFDRGFTGYAGASIAAGGGFMANTAGIMYSSMSYSMGMYSLSGGMMQPSISFGVV